jgi:hypothetical protein
MSRQKHRRDPARAARHGGGEETAPPEARALPPHNGMPFEEAVRVRAYQKWERAGCPAGDGVAFWLEAEAELSAAP